MAEAMLTYQLPNGTHLLIHQASTEDAPMLLLEESHDSDQPDDSAKFYHESSDPSVAECQATQETIQSPHKEKTKPENQILENLDEFAEMVLWYKCRICKFAAALKQDLLEHIRAHHVEKQSVKMLWEAHPASSLKRNLQWTIKMIMPRTPERRTAPALKETSTDDAVTNDVQVSELLVFLCGQCTHIFNSLDACKQHMMQDHEMIVHAVDEEEEEEVEEQPKESPKPNVTEPGPSETGRRKVRLPRALQHEYWLGRKNSAHVKCFVVGCQYKFCNEKALEVHNSCHVAGNPREFHCCECQGPFERWRNCALHLWKTHNIDAGLLTCPVCHKYKTATVVSLDNHMRIHGETRPFSCPECGKGFKQASQLRNHRVMHLDRKSANLPRWYGAKRCDICFKSYADSKCLKNHIQAVHSKLRPYVCQVCGHASARKAMLQMHYRQHTGEKPHSCPLCEYRTGDHNSLRRHLMRHTGQRPYRCPHCPYSAIQSNSYKNHLRSKHPGQSGLFCCTDCSFKTVSHESFVLHASDHKNGVIAAPSTDGGSDVEVFPGNVAAAHLIYRCLNALSTDGSSLEANVTGSNTSADGTTQTITIQIPTQDGNNKTEEDETTHFLLEIQQPEEEEGVDTGGITIPAEPEDETTHFLLEIQQPNEEEGVDTGGITIPAEPEHVAT